MSKKIFILCITAALLSMCMLTSCDIIPSDEPDRDSGSFCEVKLYFHNTKSEAMLIDPQGGLICLYSEDKSIFEPFETGDYVRVECGYMLESYPAQTYISKIELITDGDESALTDEDWFKLSGVFLDIDREGLGIPVWSPEDITEGNVVGNDFGSVSEGRIYFGENKDKALLLGADGTLVWLYTKDSRVFEPFNTGDYVKVEHGAVMLSYPGQTNISKIALLENGDVSGFTSEEIAMIERVADGFN